ncbi:ABC-type uncharacterized transport system [Symmachiella macrocystis]|uniref:ABC-type uncharacterized transport system n=1 Tax=Symmachiella macrocystis TaxID=2527985 RepID=A0A5C6BQZ6_9PLAN|nr:Gldg family protein [Symmachiella macrocystis]TWU14468.1 ABC-type uncharacterized transport system [Symmachiella macrocystis]
MSLRKHVIFAVFKRNFLSYFSGVIGYLFIVVFVALGSVLAFSDQFFANNIASLDQLNQYFPMLLLFIVPAITMSAWADERKTGTDELLFTLPASDGEIVLGKYLSVLAVYSVVLAFSLSHVVVLFMLGHPDVGQLFANYLGYWCAGAALLSAGMFASILTSSTPVAFVIGAVLCAIPVFSDRIGAILPDFLGRHLSASRLFQNMGLSEQLRDFGLGMIPLSGLLYFVSICIFMLYLNLVMAARRHWAGGTKGTQMGWQFAARAICLAVILISANVVFANWNVREDVTSEQLYSISPTTKKVLSELPEKRRILIQAFISPEVPREYVPVRTTLLGLLRQYDQAAGDQLDVRIVNTEQFSPEADEARTFGISAREVQTERAGKVVTDSVFLGAVVTGGVDDEVVIPWFDVGTPIEYELTRSIGTVTETNRRKVGILTTDAKIAGGMNMQSFSSDPEWRIVTELKKQYDVVDVSPDGPITGDFDVLIAPLPSSLTVPQLKNFVDYVKSGKPTLIFDDPMPAFNPQLAAQLPKPSPGGGGMFGQRQPAPPKGDINLLLNELGIAWDKGQSVFDMVNPHPQFASVVQPDLVFVTERNVEGELAPFSEESQVSKGLQETLLLWPGSIRPREGSQAKFIPLIRSARSSTGVLPFDQLISNHPLFGPQMLPNPKRVVDDNTDYYLAARITSDVGAGLNVVFIADMDIISNMFFQIRDRQMYDLNLDNVTFVLNAVDELAGDKEFIPLRKRRAEHRTLTTVEARTQTFVEELQKETEAANEKADEELAAANAQLTEAVEKIRNDPSLDAQDKQIRIQMTQRSLQQRLDVDKVNIESAKEKKVRQEKRETEREISAIEGRIKMWAILLPPIPALVLGIIILCIRVTNERNTIVPERLVRDVGKHA